MGILGPRRSQSSPASACVSSKYGKRRGSRAHRGRDAFDCTLHRRRCSSSSWRNSAGGASRSSVSVAFRLYCGRCFQTTALMSNGLVSALSSSPTDGRSNLGILQTKHVNLFQTFPDRSCVSISPSVSIEFINRDLYDSSPFVVWGLEQAHNETGPTVGYSRRTAATPLRHTHGTRYSFLGTLGMAALRGRVVGGDFGRRPRTLRATGTRPKSVCHRFFGSYLKLFRGRGWKSARKPSNSGKCR